MSAGKGDRNRSASKKYWENYNDINWGKVKNNKPTGKRFNSVKELKEYYNLNCIAKDNQCQANTETKE